eukprot:1998821-Amphidinium_carterae.1
MATRTKVNNTLGNAKLSTTTTEANIYCVEVMIPKIVWDPFGAWGGGTVMDFSLGVPWKVNTHFMEFMSVHLPMANTHMSRKCTRCAPVAPTYSDAEQADTSRHKV